MGKELLQFILTISSKAWGKLVEKSSRSHNNPGYGAFPSTVLVRLRQAMVLFQFQDWTRTVRTVFIAGIVGISFPILAQASDVTLAWDDKNPAVDGYLVFQRMEGQSYDYTQPAWPTDGHDHLQTSCTIADLTAGDKYFFVVRAYAGNNQSADSNEVSLVVPESSGSIVNINHPPEQPALINIADGENDVSMTPLLTASEFDDPDPADSHAATEWRIFLTGNGQQIVFNRSRDKGRLLEIRVPPLVLEPSTEYSVQVRFFDDRWMPSPWSQRVVLTTEADRNDLNQNNIPDVQEIRIAMDMNGDAISDQDQALVVKGLVTYNEEHMIGISVESNHPAVQIQAAASFDPTELASSDETVPPAGDEMPYGLIGYRIRVEPSEIITVKFNLSDPLSSQKSQWTRYDVVDGMSNSDAATDVDDSGLEVNRYLVDGGEEDADGVANGVIVDLSGPIDAAPAADNTDDASLTISDDGPAAAGGSSGGCFVQSLY